MISLPAAYHAGLPRPAFRNSHPTGDAIGVDGLFGSIEIARACQTLLLTITHPGI
jgi:hypothetical protein